MKIEELKKRKRYYRLDTMKWIRYIGPTVSLFGVTQYVFEPTRRKIKKPIILSEEEIEKLITYNHFKYNYETNYR